MKFCPITYEPISENQEYSTKGVHQLSRQVQTINPFPYSVAEQLELARNMAAKLSIQGVQPKISAQFNAKRAEFVPAAKGGRYILKPQNLLYPHLPENEDLSMRLAAAATCDIPLHGLIRGVDNQLIYFIKRFDREPRGRKLAVEDFAQLAGLTRNTKYNFSVEKMIDLIENFTTFPMIEKVKLFRLILVNFLLGNEDAHVKNFSLITRNGKVELSPCYDIVNSTLHTGADAEESALPLRGKKRKMDKDDFFTYLGLERLALPAKIIDSITSDLIDVQPTWRDIIARSFLPEEQKIRYREVVEERAARILTG